MKLDIELPEITQISTTSEKERPSIFDKAVHVFYFFLLEKRLHNGAKIALLFEKWYRFQPFFWKIMKNGSTVEPFWPMVQL